MKYRQVMLERRVEDSLQEACVVDGEDIEGGIDCKPKAVLVVCSGILSWDEERQDLMTRCHRVRVLQMWSHVHFGEEKCHSEGLSICFQMIDRSGPCGMPESNQRGRILSTLGAIKGKFSEKGA